jgi:hypothetical protein
MFLYSFLVLFEEKKSWGAMRKTTFPFSHTDPQKTHFSKKIQKVQKTHFFEKSGFPKVKSISVKKIAFFSSKWARKSENFEKIFRTDFSTRRPNTLG